MLSRRSALQLAAGAVILAPFAARAQQADPAIFISDFAEKGIVQILAANIPNKEKQERFRTLFDQYFDVPAIAEFVLSRYVRTISDADKQKFGQVFEDVVVYTWSRRFSEYNGQTLKVSTTVPDGTDGSIVKSTVLGKGGDNFEVDWRIRKRAAGLKIVDVVVAGVSMAITYRQDYTAVIAQQGGFDALMKRLEGQVLDLKQQLGA